ncbi:MAG: AAA family ATPase [Desulfobacterales bacterium]|nr:AAA family ATPase [Desulfobacterales bacterium]
MNKPSIIAFLGKGGVGKTILSALFGKIFIEQGKKVLFIDADPAMGLSTALNISGFKTIGKSREEIIKIVKSAKTQEEKDGLSDVIDYLLLESVFDTAKFSMLAMGYTDTLGCYCPLNTILKTTIEYVSSKFDVVIIDAEAGIEQVGRQVVETVNYPIIVCDNSLRSINTAILLKETMARIPKMIPTKTGVIFNRVNEIDDSLMEKLRTEGLITYGQVSPDGLISEFDKKGISILTIDKNINPLLEIQKILSEMLKMN